MNTPTPETDEWIVTDNENYIEIASTKTCDSIASVHGGKTIGDQYDLAGRIAKVPQLERELTAVTEQRDRMAEALQKLADCDWVITLPDRMDAVRKIANEALQSLTPNVKP